MTSMLTDFAVVAGITLVFVILSWGYVRSINAGLPLRDVQRKLLLYGFMFVFGMGCMMLPVSDLHGPKHLLIPLIGFWGVLLAAIGWWRHRRLKNL